jgi:transposase InsO family protein
MFRHHPNGAGADFRRKFVRRFGCHRPYFSRVGVSGKAGAVHIIESIEEAQEFATQWLWTYNNERPNMGIGGITPAQKLKTAA